MTDKELRKKAEDLWERLYEECFLQSGLSKGDTTEALYILIPFLKDAHRGGVEALRDAFLEQFPNNTGMRLVAARLLEATPNEITREAIEEAERGEGTTCNDAQTLFAHLGLDEDEKP